MKDTCSDGVDGWNAESAAGEGAAAVSVSSIHLRSRAQEEARKKLLHSLIDTEARARRIRLVTAVIRSWKNCPGGSGEGVPLRIVSSFSPSKATSALSISVEHDYGVGYRCAGEGDFGGHGHCGAHDGHGGSMQGV